MRGRLILRFLLILLVSILFSVSNRFFCYFRLLNFTMTKTDWIQFAPVMVFSKIDCLLVWKLLEYTFNHCTYLCKDVRCERSKQTVNASQDLYNIPSWWNKTYFEMNRLYAYVEQIQQADYMRRNSFLIKFKYKIDYLPKIG